MYITLISFALVDGLEPWIFNIEKTFLTAKQLELIPLWIWLSGYNHKIIKWRSVSSFSVHIIGYGNFGKMTIHALWVKWFIYVTHVNLNDIFFRYDLQYFLVRLCSVVRHYLKCQKNCKGPAEIIHQFILCAVILQEESSSLLPTLPNSNLYGSALHTS